jgi:exonuclease 3'-5' domain-containing protein 1
MGSTAAPMYTSITTVTEISALEGSVQKIRLDTEKLVKFIDTEDDLIRLVETIENVPTHPPSLYVDLEGVTSRDTGAFRSCRSLSIHATKPTCGCLYAQEEGIHSA